MLQLSRLQVFVSCPYQMNGERGKPGSYCTAVWLCLDLTAGCR